MTDRDTSAAMPNSCQLGHMYRAECVLKFLMKRANSPLIFSNDWKTCQYHYSIVNFGMSHVKGSGKEKMTTCVGNHSAVYMCLTWHPLCMHAAGFPSVESQCNVRDKNWRPHGFKCIFLLAAWWLSGDIKFRKQSLLTNPLIWYVCFNFNCRMSI